MTCDGVLWTDDVGVLIRHPDQFFPAAGLSQADNTNALVRLSLYAGVAIAVIRRKVAPLIAGIVIALFITVLFARRERDHIRVKNSVKTCRSPTLGNPMMNEPIIVDPEDRLLEPCTDGPSMRNADRYLRAYTTRDVEDVLSQEYENRQFLTLSDGGVGPDFSKLGDHLARGSNLR